jgi:autotransporter adhesin
MAAQATAAGASAFGQNARATTVNSTAIGFNALATGSTAVGANSQATGVGSAAFGAGAIASGSQSTALGETSQATAANTVAVGYGARATASGAVAVGQGAQASGTDSIAIGRGAVATQSNQIVIGSSATTVQSPSLTTPAARAAQSGPLEVVTSDANGNLATDGGELFRRQNENTEGIAMALAMAATPFLENGKNIAVSANGGYFEGEGALAFTGIARLGNGLILKNDSLYLTGGLGTGVQRGTFGARAGVTFSW